MLYKARVVIDDVLDSGLQQVFGGDAGPRFKNSNNDIPKRKVWKNRAIAAQTEWTGLDSNDDLKGKSGGDGNDGNDDDGKETSGVDVGNVDGNDAWDAWSKYAKNGYIDYDGFRNVLKDKNIKVNDELAKSLFDQIKDPNTNKITKQQMNKIINDINNMNLDNVFNGFSINDLNNPNILNAIIGKVLYAASAGEPMDVDGFILNTSLSVNFGGPGILLGKLADRDGDFNARIEAMNLISNAVKNDNPMFDNLFKPDTAPVLLYGWAGQLLDGNATVQRQAIDDIPLIFNNVLTKGGAGLAIPTLEEILNNLFKVIDDPHAPKQNKVAAQDAIDKIVNDVINNPNTKPEDILYLSGVLQEMTSIETLNNPKARQLGFDQIKKIMLGENSPYITPQKNIPKVDDKTLPKKGTINREWLDIGTNKQDGPSLPNEDSKTNTGIPTNNTLKPKEIGDEFRNILKDAVSNAIEDPNKFNQNNGKKFTDVLNDVQPKWDKNLNPEAKKRYIKYKIGPLKPYNPKGPGPKKLPPLNPGKKKVMAVDMTFRPTIKAPTMPDI